jgi:hypothetical protein
MYREVLCIKRKEIPMAADGISGGGVSNPGIGAQGLNPLNAIQELLHGGTKTDESDRTSYYLSFEFSPDKVGVDQSIVGNSMNKLG